MLNEKIEQAIINSLPPEGNKPLKEIAKDATLLISSYGYDFTISPKKVGLVLRKLGIEIISVGHYNISTAVLSKEDRIKFNV